MNPYILTLAEFRLQVYGQCGLSISTLKQRIKQDKLPGGFKDNVNGRYYVDIRKWEAYRQHQCDESEDVVVKRIVESWR